MSSRKSDISHIPAELSAIEKAECSHSSNRQDDYSCSDFSRRYFIFVVKVRVFKKMFNEFQCYSYSMSNINESNHSRLDYHSPIKNGSRCFKRPEYFR